ncbi:uncharacterized protein LOC118203951 isoform X2 [Stegodyphus dumicola]|uniref:uncharacterized protein LOC118203951 isoform X2 n=1 Tax=Stegodyphus dumicola TaxID=202533 RepID=UPI0015A95C17|nr:uncharacterized protein LOC118203951 isoform X2 [Stegodyphus dumicola]XP_035232155.1 uncharacterized protein LOC118203951 isoform X2 [Stegodyphus dumicola]XP_035232156.1 uncharacterized protein LOC118203951 isoform X2 [Stegodyphus dumicola]
MGAPSRRTSKKETPILLRLGRRHTLDVGKQAEDKNSRKSASRTASVDSLDQHNFSQRALNPTENVAFDVKVNQKPRKHFSSASTIVITESELSASWLYKNRRDAAEKNNEAFDDKPLDNERPTFSSPELNPEMQNLEQGILQDPKMKPVVVPLSRREKFSSCCCYFLIAVIICLCSLGLISAIGGIIYMELFTTYNETHLLTQTQSPNLSPFASDDYLKTSQETPSSTNQVNDLTEGELSVTEPEEDNVWNIYRIFMPRARNGKALNKEDSFSRNHQNSDSTEKNGNDPLTSLRGFFTRLIGESLRNSLNETEEAGVTRNDRQSKNESEGRSSNNSKSDLLNEAEGSLYPFGEKGAFKSDDHVGIKENLISGLGSLPEATKASNDFAFDRRSGFIKILNKSELRAVEEMSHSSKNYLEDLQMAERPNVQQKDEVYSVDINSPEKGMASKHFNESITADLYYDMNQKYIVLPTENVIPVVTPAGILIPEADKYKEHMKDFELHNPDVKYSFQKDKLTGPVLEINIPLPSEFLKRLKLEIESTTPSIPLSPLRPTDIKSSLAEVLKHLQILDKNNKLPSSRKKNFNSSGTKPFSFSKSHETRRQDVAIERSLYLQKLRTIMFDK